MTCCHRCHSEYPLGHVSFIGLDLAFSSHEGELLLELGIRRDSVTPFIFRFIRGMFLWWFSRKQQVLFVLCLFPRCLHLPLSHSGRFFKTSQFEVWSQPCMTSSADIAVHLSAGWWIECPYIGVLSLYSKLGLNNLWNKLVVFKVWETGCLCLAKVFQSSKGLDWMRWCE